MHLHPNWSVAIPGPVRYSHFQHGTVFLQLTASEGHKWVEVSLPDMVAVVGARPSVPQHGVVFKRAVKTDAAPGTRVPIRSWYEFAYEQSLWGQCTNCSCIFSMEDNCLEGCYSSHVLLTCYTKNSLG